MWSAIAGIIIGAATGIASAVSGRINNIKSNERASNLLKNQEQRALDLMDLQFDTAETEANQNADKSDRQSTLAEGAIGDTLNGTIGQLANSQNAQALNENEAAVSNDAQMGNTLSSLASNGTRSGSSVSDAASLQGAYAEAQLQMSEDTTRQNNAYSLAGALDNFAQNRGQVAEDRLSANQLRDSYKEGGSQYELYKKSRSNTQSEYQDKIDALWNEHNDLTDGWNWTLDVITAGATGGSKGYDLGSTIGQLASDSAKPSYNTSARYQANYNVFQNLDNSINTDSGYSFNSFNSGLTSGYRSSGGLLGSSLFYK